MTTEAQLENLTKAQKIFESGLASERTMKACLRLVRIYATEEPGYDMRCMNCKKAVFYAPHPEGLIEGHVYSQNGMLEYRISRYCEFCFDKVTEEDEEDVWVIDVPHTSVTRNFPTSPEEGPPF
jgi:Pyruvate/2-oxoacid:ferredoxin oxidoreductase delta subunit